MSAFYARSQKRKVIGEFRHRVKFQRRVETSNGMGGSDITWEDVAEAWAAIDQPSATQTTQALMTGQQAMYRLTVRWTETLALRLASQDRVIVNGVPDRIMNIETVQRPPKRDFIQVLARYES